MTRLAHSAPPRGFTVFAALLAASVGACGPQSPGTTVLPAQPRVTTDAGAVEGRVDSAAHVMVFRGIPYAAPPVGELRWQAPQPAAHWDGVRQADRLGHNCMQHQPY